MSHNACGDSVVPKYFKINLYWLFDAKSRKSRKATLNRCSYVRKNLNPAEIIRWAQIIAPRKWQKGTWESFLEDIRKICQQKIRCPSAIVRCLETLSETELRHSKGFRDFYLEICDSNDDIEGPQAASQARLSPSRSFSPDREHMRATICDIQMQPAAQRTIYPGNDIEVNDQVRDLLNPSFYSQVQAVNVSLMNTVLSSIPECIENSIQRQFEKAKCTSYTNTITIFTPTLPGRDGHLVIKIANDQVWKLLRNMGYVESREPVQ